ncbi:hypothetical protein [Poseidonocella sp. HB161398]|uniref:hypothetical protein n=1 Tax=Poseidonocella sp. HB161398 TaxID=2320855 RepID=UPI001F0D6D40|nr:hypothetical protein [Poseidonocella sp. HB161398]
MPLPEWLVMLLRDIEQSGSANAIRLVPHVYPILECIHILGIALLVGSAIAVDLRLMGVWGRRLRVTELSNVLLPLAHLGFGLVSVSGALLFTAVARSVGESAAAPWKFSLIGVAALNIVVFHFGIYRRISHWDGSAKPPIQARLAGAISAVCWICVLVAGRYLAYV